MGRTNRLRGAGYGDHCFPREEIDWAVLSDRTARSTGHSVSREVMPYFADEKSAEWPAT